MRVQPVRHEMGLDIFGIPLDVGQLLQSGADAVKSSAIQQAAQSQIVQASLAQTAQQKAADTLAASLLKYKTTLLIGTGVVVSLVFISLMRRR